MLLAGAAPSSGQTAENVLLVVNEANPDSIAVGEHYARVRGLAADHVFRTAMPTSETISRAQFEQTIEAPLGLWLTSHLLQDQILYLVLARGVPLRIQGSIGLTGTVSSVDSELTLLYRKIIGEPWPLTGRVDNPYFQDAAALSEARPFTRFSSTIYLVTRLDAFTTEEAIALVDRGVAPGREGSVVLDQRRTVIDRGGDRFLQEAGERLEQAGLGERVMLETSRAVASATGPVIGYYSWGSNDPANRLRRFGLTFVNGAIGAMFVSSDGRTFTEPPADWTPGESKRPAGLFGSGSQSLAGDLIRDGITGVAGHVAEPFLDATVRPQILFPAYLSGFNLAESFYLAMPFLSWQTIVVGDPLCSPFAREPFGQSDLHQGLDPETGLPALYVERRLQNLARTGLKAAGLKVWLKAEAARLKGDDEGRRALLVDAVTLEPRLTIAAFELATLAEGREDYDEAIARYRDILAVEKDNVPALNNLAYALAVRKGTPAEALPLAERAYRLANQAIIADTVAWIHHLMGNHLAARPLIERAVAGAPTNTDVLVHAAFIHAATGDLDKARTELAAAEKLDPTVSERAEVKALRERIRRQPGRRVPTPGRR